MAGKEETMTTNEKNKCRCFDYIQLSINRKGGGTSVKLCDIAINQQQEIEERIKIYRIKLDSLY